MQVQLLVSDSDVESYKQIKSDLDVLRQSVEKSELWVYKCRSDDGSGTKLKEKDDEDEGGVSEITSKGKTMLRDSGKQNSATDLDPLLYSDQANEYNKIQQVIIIFQSFVCPYSTERFKIEQRLLLLLFQIAICGPYFCNAQCK